GTGELPWKHHRAPAARAHGWEPCKSSQRAPDRCGNEEAYATRSWRADHRPRRLHRDAVRRSVMAESAAELADRLQAAVIAGFRRRLLDKGLARGMIWREGALPEGAPEFSESL